jgi:hypothetical protein
MSKTIKQIIRAVDNWDSDEAADYELEEFKELELIESFVISKKDYDYYKSYEHHKIYKHIPTNKFYKFKIKYSSWEGREIVKFLGEVELKEIITTKSKWIVKDKEKNV